MAVSDLDALFDSVDGLKEDLVEYGLVAAAAIGSNMAWNWATRKFVPVTAPAWVDQYAIPAVAMVGGIYLGRTVGQYNRQAGQGVAFGLVTAGLAKLVKQIVPDAQIPGLAGTSDSLYGLGAYSAPRYLPQTSPIEEVNAGGGGEEFGGEYEEANVGGSQFATALQ
jgi:hypothetical protein